MLESSRPRTARHFAEDPVPDGIRAILVAHIEIRFLALRALVIQERVELKERLGVGAERALDALLKLDDAPSHRAMIEPRLDCHVDRMPLQIVASQRRVVTSADAFSIVPFRADRYLAHW